MMGSKEQRMNLIKRINLIIRKNVVKIRGLISSLLLIISIIVIFTGIGLYFAPSGRIAREMGWNFLGFDKFKLEMLHTVTGFIMVVIVVIHLIINYKMFIGEIKQLFRTKNKAG